MEELGTYVKKHPETNEEMERTPDTPAQVVALEFDGWVKKAKRSSSGSTSSKPTSSS